MALTASVPAPDGAMRSGLGSAQEPHFEVRVVSPVGMDASGGYTVRAGDTLFTVALELGVDLEDVPCAIAPDFRVDQPLVIGDTLSIPPASLACHTVQSGDTLSSVAAQYGSSAEQIYLLPWNRLAGVEPQAVALTPGSYLRVPLPLPAVWNPSAAMPGADNPDGLTSAAFLPLMLSLPTNTSPFAVLGQGGQARKPQQSVLGPVPSDWPYGSGHFTWPVYGWLSQSYRYDHRAIDVAATQGTPVTAADRGVVVRAGWNDQGYGRFVVIDHQIDYVTLYAHLDRILVAEGDIVGQGQVLGTVGSTGNSTGPHLHFEIRDFGRLSNPLELLSVP
jgi:murein DD-endopeptidase MepM/ murein hydrolase activator NlpD